MNSDHQQSGFVVTIQMPVPSIKDNTADAERMIQSLAVRLHAHVADITIDFALLQQLPELFRRCRYRVRCVVFKDRKRWIICGIQPDREHHPPLGLAVDLGTTNVVLRLINLLSGNTLAETIFDNPQIGAGADILTRVHLADTIEGREHLNRVIIDGINRHIDRLCSSKKSKPSDIYLMALAGNTTMTHLLMGLPPHGLIREPYIPVVNRPGAIKATELGLHIHEHGRVFVFPNIGSYFGGDLIAGILHTDIHKSEGVSLLVDVGTNAEVVLGNSEWLIACAGAAGPALEGGVTEMGMMAGPGVIDQIQIDPHTLQFHVHTIAEHMPRGICGSGLIDLAAQLFVTEMIDIRGRFRSERCGRRLVDIDGIPHLIVVPASESATHSDLTISQADIDSLIRSKAAMYTILETITQTVGLSISEIDTFYVAGTFGAYIQPESAITIGMLPDLPRSRYKSIGNSAIEGAVKLLSLPACIEEVDHIRDRIMYLELNVNQDFMNRFSAAKFIPHTDPHRFPSLANRSGNPGSI